LHTVDLYTYNVRTFIQTPAQNQDDPNVMRSAVIHFRQKVSVGKILFGCTSRFNWFSNKLPEFVGLNHICKLRQYHNTVQGHPSKANTRSLEKCLHFRFQYVQIDFHTSR